MSVCGSCGDTGEVYLGGDSWGGPCDCQTPSEFTVLMVSLWNARQMHQSACSPEEQAQRLAEVETCVDDLLEWYKRMETLDSSRATPSTSPLPPNFNNKDEGATVVLPLQEER